MLADIAKIFALPDNARFAEVLYEQARFAGIVSMSLVSLVQLNPLLSHDGLSFSGEIVAAIDNHIINHSDLSFKFRARLHKLMPYLEKL